MHVPASSIVLLLAAAASWISLQAAERAIPPAFGRHVRIQEKDFTAASSFRSSDRIVGTYYFYWYDIHTKAHIVDGDGTDALTTHPPTLDDFSFKSVRWHKRQLADMIDAGIDVVLPVFWGAPSEHEPGGHLHWSYAGLPPLVQAREELVREGRQPPRIGLFYDTSTLQHNEWRERQDLTSDRGRQWFYATMRDFFSLVPPKHWAMIDGQPVVLLYSAAFARHHDQTCIDYAKAEFPKEFAGRVPWIAREISWQVKADSTVAWGGALGLKNPGIASLGPGYDHSAVPGREPLVVARRGGKFYEENWLKLLRRPSNFVMVETWNEFHEGTDVCESKEFGRQYIELTRKYVGLFKRGDHPPWPKGAYSGANSVRVILGQANREEGLRQVDHDDGVTEPADAAGRDGRASKATRHAGRYIYFVSDDSFKRAGAMELNVEVDFFDAAEGVLSLEFDGSDLAAPFGGAYTRVAESVRLTGNQAWKTGVFQLSGARLLNSQNRGADFRLVVETPKLIVREVRLLRR